mgnify:CR=1 FL=1
MREPLYISVRSLRFPGIDNMYVVIIKVLRLVSRHPVCIKYGNEVDLLNSLIIAQYIKKPSSCSVYINCSNILKLIPRKYNIIANSTFSYWAARLNKKTNMVIYPSKWYNTFTPDIFPESWCGI